MADVRTRIVIDADSRRAVSALDDVTGAAGDADRELRDLDGTRVDLDANAGVRELDRLEDAVDDADRAVRDLDGESIKVDTTADTSALDRADTELDDLRTLAAKPITVDVNVDDAALDRVRRTGDGVRDIGDRANALQSGIGPLRGFTDELGGTAGAAGTATNALVDAGEAVQIFGDQLGLSQRTLNRVALGLGGVGLAVGAATFAWSKYREAQDKAREKAEELLGVQEQLSEGKYREAAEKLTETYGDLFTGLEDEGLDVAEAISFITGETDTLSTEIEGFSNLKGLLELRGGFEQAGEEMASNTRLSGELEAAFKAQGTAGDKAGDDGAAAQKRLEDAARLTERAIDRVTGEFDRMSDRISDDRSAINVAEAFDRVETAALEAWTAAAEGSADAEQKARDYRLAQLDAKQAVIDYATEVGNIPPDVVTTILTEIDQGKYDSAESAIAELEKDRRTSVFVDLIQGKQLNSYSPYVSAPGVAPPRSITQNITVNATPSMREVDAATTRWQRLNGS